MPHCQTTNQAAPSAPSPLVFISRLFETLLAQVICFFDALERLILPYAILVTIGSIGWSIHHYGVISGTMFGIPLGMVMALVHGLAIVIIMFVVGLLLWLALIPIYLIASSCHWQLPTVLEHNPTVEYWMKRWSRRSRRQEPPLSQSTTKQLAGLMIGVLLGCWLVD
ncbi:MAG: hypothetical protein JRG71_09150 [Deltaproteobacteria bacterium]|nr:hypothetical protein [Deltaproteobacteria bacterium]